jgi:hypothetical protein
MTFSEMKEAAFLTEERRPSRKGKTSTPNYFYKSLSSEPLISTIPGGVSGWTYFSDAGSSGTLTGRKNIEFCQGIPEEKSAGKTGVVGKWWMVGRRKPGC